MNNPKIAPTTLKARPIVAPSRPAGRPPRSLTHVSSAETATKNPKTVRAHTPTDIGDQYLKFKPVSPGVTSTSMCQNLDQLAPRSAVNRIGQITIAARLK